MSHPREMVKAGRNCFESLKKAHCFSLWAILTPLVRFVKSFRGKGVGAFQFAVPNPVEKTFGRTFRICETETASCRRGL